MPSRSDRTQAVRGVALLVCLTWLGGCTDALIEPLDGQVDGAAPDASPGDAGSDAAVDAGRDARAMDAGDNRDAGDGVDAGGSDAGEEDAGGTDAGPGAIPDAHGQIVITEIMYDSDVVTDDDGEWFEVHNPGDVTWDLDGCLVSDESNFDFIDEPLPIAPGEFLSLGRFPSAAVGGFDPDFSYTSTKLANEGDTLTLTCDGTVIDEVAYHSFDRDKGQSMSLDPDSYDADANDSGANWCNGVDIYHMGGGEVDRGTPGEPNPDC